MKEKLKPCPFCGKKPQHTQYPEGLTATDRTSFIHFVGCGKCHAYITSGYGKLAIKAWNRRVK